MSVAQYVFRRGATYVWRRRLPVDAPEEGVLQVSLRTRDPHRARRIAAVVTAESSAIFNTMVQKRLTPKEARALFDRVVREESERLSRPTAPLSHFRARRPSLKIPEADRFQLYALSLLRALRHGELDEDGENLLNHIRTAWGDEAFSDACYHFNDEALTYAAPFLRGEDRHLAEETVNAALRRAGGVDDEELLAAYRRADGPLNLLEDGAGIKFLGSGEWQTSKHGPQGRRQWRRVHLAMDPATSDTRAVEFTLSRDGDSPVLPDLLSQILEDEQIGTVSADGAYDTRWCYKAITYRQGTAIIPIRSNGRLWKEDCPAARTENDTLRATRYYGRAFWKRWTRYHARSRIEAKLRCLKSFGVCIMARDPGRQTDEIRIPITPGIAGIVRAA